MGGRPVGIQLGHPTGRDLATLVLLETPSLDLRAIFNHRVLAHWAVCSAQHQLEIFRLLAQLVEAVN